MIPKNSHIPTCAALPVSLNMPCSARNSPDFYCWHTSRVLKSFVWVSTRESGYGLALHFPHITQILDMVPRGIHFNLNTSVMDSRMDSCAFFLSVVHLHLGVSGDRLLFYSFHSLSMNVHNCSLVPKTIFKLNINVFFFLRGREKSMYLTTTDGVSL